MNIVMNYLEGKFIFTFVCIFVGKQMVGIDYYKKNKILIAVIDKGRSRNPSMEYPFDFLFNRCIEELCEILNVKDVDENRYESLYSVMMRIERELDKCKENESDVAYIDVDIPLNLFNELYNELADVSNFVDFMFNRVSRTEQLLKMHEVIP